MVVCRSYFQASVHDVSPDEGTTSCIVGAVTDHNRATQDTTSPTWVEIAGYVFEKIHTNVLARALNSGLPAANQLAAKLWERASGEVMVVDEVSATTEAKLGRGRHSVVDLLVGIKSNGDSRRLAVEVKVDGAPNGPQLKAMEAGLASETDRLVLLTLGAAQVSRLEDSGRERSAKWWWTVQELLDVSELIVDASPRRDVALEWLAELKNEDDRRKSAFNKKSLAWVGRAQAKRVYQYALVAKELEGVSPRISIRPFGVVMTIKSRQFENVYVYLEFVNGVVAVKAGTQTREVNPREVTRALVPKIRTCMEARGIAVTPASRRSGRWVSLLWLDRAAVIWSLDDLVQRAKRALEGWSAIDWNG